jgi:hypothetical protein
MGKRFLRKEVINHFSLDDYDYYINLNRYSSDRILGPVDDAEIAKEKAEDVWIELFGDSVTGKRPYQVMFDETNEVWLVQGTLPKKMLGGIPYIIIQKTDGKVLAVWHDK